MSDEPRDGLPQPPGEPFGRSVLFVCTGNTCRSPLAEGLCRKLIADRLGIAERDLPARGIQVRSAGIAAFAGDTASPEAVDVATQLGVDLSRHRSRPVNPELLTTSTDIIAMTAGHLALLAMRFPGDGPTPELLAGSDDIPDPIGGTHEAYVECATQIQNHLERRIAEWMRI